MPHYHQRWAKAPSLKVFSGQQEDCGCSWQLEGVNVYTSDCEEKHLYENNNKWKKEIKQNIVTTNP